MLIDLLSTNNYVSYNIKVAQVLGLHPAIYLSEMMNINDKAIRKNKTDGQYFTVDREYFKARTMLDEAEQLQIEDSLLKVGILEKTDDNPNSLFLNVNMLTSILMSPDEQLIQDVSKIIAKKNNPSKKRTKAEVIREGLKQNITAENDELRAAYYDWIDSAYAKNGWLSKTAIIEGQKTIDNYCNRNLDMALYIIKVASINGYRDMQWAVNKFEADNKVHYKVNAPKTAPVKEAVQASEEVF